ncbi:hypothetical protein N0V90_007262 [Kalmusia sp. IMI 367209]|nr:hypothetical protein N0V90_007262 [Kalmusia sp. IMI 367209]
MWMNMGYWRNGDESAYSADDHPNRGEGRHTQRSKTMAEACRDLLFEVATTASILRKKDSSESQSDIKKRTCVIDLGFGCGDQTAYLMGIEAPGQVHVDSKFGVYFDYYVGITLDKKQFQFAQKRIQHDSPPFHRGRDSHRQFKDPKVQLFCADASNPGTWSAELKGCIRDAISTTQEHWLLALDTAYHFSPSRWPVIKHACQNLDASFAAFDLCLSPTASFRQKVILRLLTSLMGAPWANFVTADEYRTKLIEAGYDDSQITIRDISEDVFGPLVAFLEQQDRDLRVVGLGLGSLNVARLMFEWWAQSGIIRGCIVVAKRVHDQEHVEA